MWQKMQDEDERVQLEVSSEEDLRWSSARVAIMTSSADRSLPRLTSRDNRV